VLTSLKYYNYLVVRCKSLPPPTVGSSAPYWQLCDALSCQRGTQLPTVGRRLRGDVLVELRDTDAPATCFVNGPTLFAGSYTSGVGKNGEMAAPSSHSNSGLPDAPARWAAFAEIAHLESLRGQEMSDEDLAGIDAWMNEGGYRTAVLRVVADDPDLAD
jgi:hypothetical protein